MKYVFLLSMLFVYAGINAADDGTNVTTEEVALSNTNSDLMELEDPNGVTFVFMPGAWQFGKPLTDNPALALCKTHWEPFGNN